MHDRTSLARSLIFLLRSREKTMNRDRIVLRIGVVRSALAAVGFAVITSPVAAADLALQVSGLKNTEGIVAIAVFAKAGGFPREDGKAIRAVRIPIDAPSRSAQTIIRNLPTGDYAVAVYHDDNKSGTLETNFFGIPVKGYGFSQNPRPRMRAPTFDEALFSLPETGAELDIALIY
jgi:uncharacterized protein (DUF2141 family)